MGKPDAPEDKATTGAEKSPLEQPGMKDRRQVIEEYISSLREFLRRLQDRLH